MFVQAFDALKIPEQRFGTSENSDLPEHFTSTFSLVMPFSHDSEHTIPVT